MALSDDDFVHTNKGFVAAGANPVVSLAGADSTTAGNSVVVFMGIGSVGITGIPAGFVAQGSTGSTAPACWIKSDVSAGETSWTFTGATGDYTWVVLEVSNLETVEPLDVSTMSSQTSLSNGGTLATPAATSVGLSTVQFAVFYAAVISGTATKSWGSFTNDFTLIDQIDPTSGSNRPALAITRTFNEGWVNSFTSTGTLTISTGSAIACRARMYIFREKDSPISAQMSFFTGWEFGTHGGMGDPSHTILNGSVCLLKSTTAPVGTWGTHYQVGAGFAYGGSGYGLQIATSAATAYLPINAGLGLATGSFLRRLRVVSGSGTPVVTVINSTATDLELVYDVATEKYGLRWGSGGSAEWQTGTTPLNTWAVVDVRYHIGTTVHHAEWWCETGDGDGHQISPADLTGQVASTVTYPTVGGMVSQTLTMDVDEVGESAYYAAHPIPSFKVVRLVPEATGATVSGTATNFNRFTANGTLAAVSVDTVGALLDECPPTVSASADGLVQVTLAASDYVQLPMQTYTLAADEVIAGVRIVAALWDGTGTGVGTFNIRGWDGTTETDVIPLAALGSYDAASPTAIASGDPWWGAGTWLNGWTQTKLDAACVRVGFSGDATPDKGVSALYLEVAIRNTLAPGVAHRLTSDEDPEAVAATVTERLHPDTSGVRTYTVSNNDATRTAVFNYSIGGTPQTPITVAPTDPPEDVTVNAEAFGEVDSTSFGWQ